MADKGASHSPASVKSRSKGSRLALMGIVAAGLIAGLYVLGSRNYLLFHSVVETFSIVIAFAIFAIAWNSRRVVQDGYLLFIGIAFLAVVPLDLIHMLAYQGMGVFPGYDANPATQFWLAGRYILSLSLLAAPLFVRRKLKPVPVIAAFIVADTVLAGTIFTGIFPVAYVSATGLTPFKVGSEYAISFVLLCAIGVMVAKRREFSPDFVKLMVAAMVTTIFSEMAFTLYSDIYGITNMVGHLLKVASYYLVYKALVETSLVKPYDVLFRDLKQSEVSLAQQTADLTESNNLLVQEVVERKKAQEMISRQEKRYHETLDGMLEGCQIIGFDWQYLYVNDAAARQGRRSKEDLLGHTMMEAYPGIENTELFACLAESMTARQPCRMENEFRHGDGTTAWFELGIQPVPEGVFVLSLDVTERKQSEQMKDEFIGMVSHELKSPLTVIVGALSTAASGAMCEEDVRDLILDAASGADELATIIDNLLELSRQQASRLILQTEPVDISEAARNVVKKLASKSSLHRLVVDVPQGLPCIGADKVRVERILYNLVDNAIKYSPKGGEVRISAHPDGGYVHVAVSDQGIGMNKGDQARLFQSFERLAASGSIQGIGLGLKVCRILVEAHGGRIWVESEPEIGSTFHFTLPVEAD